MIVNTANCNYRTFTHALNSSNRPRNAPAWIRLCREVRQLSLAAAYRLQAPPALIPAVTSAPVPGSRTPASQGRALQARASRELPWAQQESRERASWEPAPR